MMRQEAQQGRRRSTATVGSRLSLQSCQSTPTWETPSRRANNEGALLDQTGERLMAQLRGGREIGANSMPAEQTLISGAVEVKELTQLLKQGLKLQGQEAKTKEAGKIPKKPQSSSSFTNVPPVFHQSFREVVFEPPWQHRVGQLQGVVEALRCHSRYYLRARRAIIVRCFPFGSARGETTQPWVYMELVYHLLYAISETQQGSLVEIQPILLDYSMHENQDGPSSTAGDKTGCASSTAFSAATTGNNTTSAMCRQIKWTPCSLLRCRFLSEEQAQYFLRAFNNSASAVFDRQVMRVPFAHADQTWPERQLRHQLQAFCKERNRSGGRRWNERLFHNGVQVFKLVGNSRVGTVRLEDLPPPIRHSHSVVCTLRKYAQLYEEKRFNAIIQNLPLRIDSFHQAPIPQSDNDLLDKLVARVLHSEGYRESLGRGSAESLANAGYRVHRLQRRQFQPAAGISRRPPPPPLVRVQFESAREAASFIRQFGAVYRMEIDIAFKHDGAKRAYAHPDLTPPELALSYALNDYCRGGNNGGGGGGRGGRYYTRHSKVFERGS